MAEETPTAAAQAAENAQNPSPAESQTPAASQADDKGDDTANLSQEQVLELNKKLLSEKRDANKEAQKLRADLKALQDADSKRKEAEMSDLEKATSKATEMETRMASIQARLITAEIKSTAASLGFADPAIAAKLIDAQELTLDDEGLPTNAKEVLEKLLKAHPYLKQGGLPATNRAAAGGAERTEDQKRKEAADNFPFLKRRQAAVKP